MPHPSKVLRAVATGSSYFAGFILGCLILPRLIMRVGHIRVFATVVASAIGVILLSSHSNLLPVWLILRFISGLCFAGIYMVVESWLNEQAPAAQRGSILSI